LPLPDVPLPGPLAPVLVAAATRAAAGVAGAVEVGRGATVAGARAGRPAAPAAFGAAGAGAAVCVGASVGGGVGRGVGLGVGRGVGGGGVLRTTVTRCAATVSDGSGGGAYQERAPAAAWTTIATASAIVNRRPYESVHDGRSAGE
jgi:hypothetical protein